MFPLYKYCFKAPASSLSYNAMDRPERGSYLPPKSTHIAT